MPVTKKEQAEERQPRPAKSPVQRKCQCGKDLGLTARRTMCESCWGGTLRQRLPADEVARLIEAGMYARIED